MLNLIPFVPTFLLSKTLLGLFNLLTAPRRYAYFFQQHFSGHPKKPRGGLLSSVFILSILLSANRVNSIFTVLKSPITCENYEISLSSIYILWGECIANFSIIGRYIFIYYKLILKTCYCTLDWIGWGQYVFFIVLAYFSISILYYFGTIQGKLTRFFSPGALMTFLLFIYVPTFWDYVDRFLPQPAYGSIEALLIFMLYVGSIPLFIAGF